VLKPSKLDVTGDADPRMTSAPVKYDQKILSKSYYDQLNKFNTVAAQQLQYNEYIDYNNVSPNPQ
jgi:hypothetical protein